MSAKATLQSLAERRRAEARRLREQATAATTPKEKMELLKKLLNFAGVPVVMKEIHAAFTALNELPVLDINRQDEIKHWCGYLRSLPAEEAIRRAKPLQPVAGDLIGRARDEYDRLVRWVMFGENPA